MKKAFLAQLFLPFPSGTRRKHHHRKEVKKHPPFFIYNQQQLRLHFITKLGSTIFTLAVMLFPLSGYAQGRDYDCCNNTIVFSTLNGKFDSLTGDIISLKKMEKIGELSLSDLHQTMGKYP